MQAFENETGKASRFPAIMNPSYNSQPKPAFVVPQIRTLGFGMDEIDGLPSKLKPGIFLREAIVFDGIEEKASCGELGSNRPALRTEKLRARRLSKEQDVREVSAKLQWAIQNPLVCEIEKC